MSNIEPDRHNFAVLSGYSLFGLVQKEAVVATSDGKLDQALDRWSKTQGSGKLRVYRRLSIYVGIPTTVILVIIWLFRVVQIINGVEPTLAQFIWEQVAPWFFIVLPCYYLWYFSDLGLTRNFYDQY